MTLLCLGHQGKAQRPYKDVFRQLEPLRAETGFHQTKRKLPLRPVHFVEANPLPLVKVTIVPLPPFLMIDVKHRAQCLLVGQSIEERNRCLSDRLGANSRRLNLEKTFFDGAVRRHSDERIVRQRRVTTATTGTLGLDEVDNDSADKAKAATFEIRIMIETHLVVLGLGEEQHPPITTP